MSKFTPLDAELKALIQTTTKLKAALGGKAASWGIPPDPAQFPGYTALRFDGLMNLNGKEGGYLCNLNLWVHNTTTMPFLEKAEELQDALNTSGMIIADGYIIRNESGANTMRALYRIEFYL